MANWIPWLPRPCFPEGERIWTSWVIWLPLKVGCVRASGRIKIWKQDVSKAITFFLLKLSTTWLQFLWNCVYMHHWWKDGSEMFIANSCTAASFSLLSYIFVNGINAMNIMGFNQQKAMSTATPKNKQASKQTPCKGGVRSGEKGRKK